MRKLSIIILGLAAGLVLTYNGCKHEPEEYIPPPPDPDTTICDTSNVTYTGSVYPIFNQHCIFCHNSTDLKGGLDLTDYSMVSAVASSGLLLDVLTRTDTTRMPKGGDALSACEIRTIEIWINDTTFAPPVDTTGHPCDPDTVYFEMDVLPIFVSSCGMPGLGCHDPGSASEGVILVSYDYVMNSNVITPGNPNDSELYEKITETDPDKIMPQPPNPPLDPAQIEIIRKWIAQGAQNLTCDEACDTTNVTYSGTIEPLINENCLGCHSGPSAQSGIHLENHDQVAYQAGIPAGQPGSLWGAVTNTDPAKRMPRFGAPLSDCKLDQIRIWIDAGRLDN